MKTIKFILLLSLLAVGLFYLIDNDKLDPEQTIKNIEETLQPKDTEMELKSSPDNIIKNIEVDGTLYSWIGEGVDRLTNSFGQPSRKDPSSYGYTWWIYTDEKEQYIQFGVKGGKVVTTFATGSGIQLKPVSIGQTYDKVNQELEFQNELSFTEGVQSYRFTLSPKDLTTRPLVKISKGVFAQFYFDSFTDTLSSIRVVNKEVLLKQRPYEIHYRGELPEPPVLSDGEWKKIEQGMEQQIFEITNLIRTNHNLERLEWNDNAGDVAFGHSKDMSVNNYFSHFTPSGDGLKERLSEEEVHYLSAGENIAAQYTDAPAAVAGWLNSKGHREAMLKDNFTHLGVGVYRYYYTQNFLQKF